MSCVAWSFWPCTAFSTQALSRAFKVLCFWFLQSTKAYLCGQSVCVCVCVCVCAHTSDCVCTCMHVRAQSCPILCNPMDCSPLGSSVHGIFQAKILEQVAKRPSRGSSWPRDRTSVSWISCTGRQILFLCVSLGISQLLRLYRLWYIFIVHIYYIYIYIMFTSP